MTEHADKRGRDGRRMNPRSLANLRPHPEHLVPGAGAAGPGNRRGLKHGGYARVAVERIDAKAREVFDALASDAPLRAPDGDLPRHDAAIVRLLADVLCRLDDVSADVRDHGWRDRETGESRPVVELEARLRREAADYLDALGMTPRARGRLGLDVARGISLAERMAADDA